MRVSNFYDCASTYLNRIPTVVNTATPSKKNERKVEAVRTVHNDRRYRSNSGTKANFAGHIDICI